MIEIYSPVDPEWNNYLSFFSSTNNQLHFTSQYHKLFSDKNNEPILFIYKEESDCFYYPFIKRKINNVYFDATSVFGYTGPLNTSQNSDFLNSADRALINFLNEQNIISELVRFNPMIENHNIYIDSNKLNLVEIKDYVIIETWQSIENLFLQITPRLKTYIRKAEKKYNNCIKVASDATTLSKFFSMYKKHMIYLKADDYYLFTDKYFEELAELVKKSGFLIYTAVENEIVAGLLFLSLNTVGYYHHGARNIENPDSSLMNKLLFWKSIEHLSNEGVDYCLLGGGVSNENDDSLLKFKKDYGGVTRKLWLGKRVINKKVYDEICSEWEQKNPTLAEKYNSHIDKFHFKS